MKVGWMGWLAILCAGLKLTGILTCSWGVGSNASLDWPGSDGCKQVN